MQLPALALLALSLLACSAPPSPRSPPPPPPSPDALVAPAATWLELASTRMLVTTTAAAAPDAAQLPLLVVLPWARSHPEEVLAELGYAHLSVPARIVVLQPYETDSDGFSWWRRARPAPSPADPDHDDELVSLLSDRAARLATLLPLLQQHFASPAPPVVSGVSQGGDLSIALAVHHSATISAALSIAARFPAPLWPPPSQISSDAAAPRPLLDAFHGALDPIAPLPALERALQHLRASNLPAALHPIPDTKHEITPALRAALHACASLRLLGDRQPCR